MAATPLHTRSRKVGQVHDRWPPFDARPLAQRVQEREATAALYLPEGHVRQCVIPLKG